MPIYSRDGSSMMVNIPMYFQSARLKGDNYIENRVLPLCSNVNVTDGLIRNQLPNSAIGSGG